MSELLDDVDLAREEFLEEVARHVALGDDFDGDVALVSRRVSQLDAGERTASECLDHTVAVLLQDRMT